MRNNKVDKDDWSDHWDSYAEAASENPAQSMRHEILEEMVLKYGAQTDLLLDIGSGQGDFLKRAAQKRLARKLIGFEMSSSGVRISKGKVPSAEFYEVDLFNPTEEANAYLNLADIVVCSDVIEHVDDPVVFCSLIKRYMKPGAVLVLTVPGGPMSAFDKYIGHRVHFNRRSVSNVLSKAGLTVLNTRMFGFPFFNLYRLVVILRGKRLIDDVRNQGQAAARPSALLAMAIFRKLFKFNINFLNLGWQVVAVSRKDLNKD